MAVKPEAFFKFEAVALRKEFVTALKTCTMCIPSDGITNFSAEGEKSS